MALIKCYECGKEVSDKAEICPHCSAPLVSKCYVYGYEQSFLVNPMVSICINGIEVGKIGNIKKSPMPFELNIDKDCTLEFKCSFRKAKFDVKAGKITKIKISWNRITGELQASVKE